MFKVPLNRNLSFLIGLMISTHSFAQGSVENLKASADDIVTPYNPQGDYQTWGIKGKLLPWTFGNAGGLNGLLGFEIGFLKNNSIGIDGYFYADEDALDRNTVQNPNIPSLHYDGIDRAVFLNYRHYFNLKKIRENLGTSLYIGILTRYGRSDDTWDRGLSSDSIIYEGRTYYSGGPFTGFIYKFKKCNNLYLDINFQFLYNDKYVSSVYSNQLQLTSTHGQFKTYDMRVGINLYWCFYYKS